MAKLQELSDAFKLQYEKFINGCDAMEEAGNWDISRDGNMETYYFNDIMCVIVMVISADGTFSEEEARYINEIFGFSYSAEELAELYRTNGSDIRNMLEGEVPAGYKRIKSLDTDMAQHYRNMLLLACDILAESDGVIQISEMNAIEKIKSSLQ